MTIVRTDHRMRAVRPALFAAAAVFVTVVAATDSGDSLRGSSLGTPQRDCSIVSGRLGRSHFDIAAIRVGRRVKNTNSIF
jgi:hypothetical protein